MSCGLQGQDGTSIAGKMPALLLLTRLLPCARVMPFWESVAYGNQTEVTRAAQVLPRSAEVSY